MKLKTINDIISQFEGHSDGWQTRWDYSQIENMLRIQAEQFIDYASKNVEADITIIGGSDLTEKQIQTMFDENVEIYIPKGEFNKIKELIK